MTSGALAETETEGWKTKADGRALLRLTILLWPRVEEEGSSDGCVPSVLFLLSELGCLMKPRVSPT